MGLRFYLENICSPTDSLCMHFDNDFTYRTGVESKSRFQGVGMTLMTWGLATDAIGIRDIGYEEN